MKRARLIYNPTSGQEIMKKHVTEVLKTLESFGYETSAFETTPEHHSAKHEATRAAKSGFDLLVIAGGDGTIDEAVNGIARLSQRPKLAIIPCGTTNDFARALKIPRNKPVEAAKVVGRGESLRVDVGYASSDKYFINIAAGGALTELTYSVPANMKTIFGYLAYITKGVGLLPQIHNTPVRIKHDQGVYEGEISMFFAALTNSVGGFEQIAPDAKIDDGKFTLILVKTDKLNEILALLALAVNGRHTEDINLEYVKSTKIEIEPLSEEKMLINLDGEYGGDVPIEFVNLQKHLEICVDLNVLNDEKYIGDEEFLAQQEVARKFAEEAENLGDLDS